MADRLRRAIYHEKQEPGSNLCAQHALNSLLQQPLFTATDLASIAQNLDTMEQSYDDNHRGRSTNMDDSGFFSVQVLENALQVWGLTLARWRSQEMRPYLDIPHTQLAFILNLELHWFTLRRFGPAQADVNHDPGDGHWFNLNSFLSEPEWVSKTYLGMVLQQAETEGYSVFIVVQIDPTAPLALVRTDADDVAASIPEITSGAKHLSTSRTAPEASNSTANDWSVSGAEDEDMALQAALFASVMGESAAPSSAPEPPRPAALHGTSDEWDIGNTSSFFGGSRVVPATTGESSVDASARRAREELARFQEEQMRVLDDRSDSDEVIASVLGRRQNVASETLAAEPQARQRRRQEDEEEEEMIRRAIEASKREAQEKGHADDSEEEEMSLDEDQEAYDEGYEEREQLERLMQERKRKQREQEAQEMLRRGLVDDAEDDIGHFGQNAEHLESRTYDDEDAQLQAALKASLEGGSVDIAVPTPPKPTRAPTRQDSTEVSAASTSKPVPLKAVSDDEDEEDDEEEDDEPEAEPEESPKPLTAEEMRKARLARFGGP